MGNERGKVQRSVWLEIKNRIKNKTKLYDNKRVGAGQWCGPCPTWPAHSRVCPSSWRVKPGPLQCGLRGSGVSCHPYPYKRNISWKFIIFKLRRLWCFTSLILLLSRDGLKGSMVDRSPWFRKKKIDEIIYKFRSIFIFRLTEMLPGREACVKIE